MRIFEWYETIEEGDLEQGDLLQDCLEPLPPSLASDAPPQPTIAYGRVVILTQSCDLAKGAQRVMVAPVYELESFVNDMGGTKNDTRSKLQAGRYVNYHLLNSCLLPGAEAPHLVVDFSDAFSVPRSYAEDIARLKARRVRLLPPYREHLAQQFARFYMRVGLPTPVAPFPKVK